MSDIYNKLVKLRQNPDGSLYFHFSKHPKAIVVMAKVRWKCFKFRHPEWFRFP